MKTTVKLVAISIVIICAVSGGVAQEKLRRIEQPARYVYPNTPIQVSLRMNGKPLQLATEVKAGPDWVQRISLEVDNISGKDINWLVIYLVLREHVRGVHPSLETSAIDVAVELSHSESNIKILPAGERVTLKPPVGLVEHWTKATREQGMEDIEKVILDIKQVGFTDGSSWYRGLNIGKASR